MLVVDPASHPGPGGRHLYTVQNCGESTDTHASQGGKWSVFYALGGGGGGGGRTLPLSNALLIHKHNLIREATGMREKQITLFHTSPKSRRMKGEPIGIS